MDFLTILLIAVGLSMDSFAVSISRGICTKQLKITQALLLAVIFGFFQGFMPLIGFGVGLVFSAELRAVDHWIAFALLFFIGGKMIYEGIKGKENEKSSNKFL